MKKILIISGSIIALVCGGLLVAYFYTVPTDSTSFFKKLFLTETKPVVLKQEDISNITKPAVVSIYHHVKGKAIIPYFNINWNSLEITFSNPNNKKPIEIPLDEYFRGSGFVISPSGYIVTNAHVASNAAYTIEVARSLVGVRFLVASQSVKEMTEFDKAMKAKGVKDVDAEEFAHNLALDFANKLSKKITIDAEQKLVVLNPSSTATKISDLIDHGYPATLVSANDNFASDQKDVAILKIDAGKFPSVELGDSTLLDTGEPIYVYGFPESATLNGNDALQPTFTEGTISSFKDSINKDFKIIQTNAKVSPGSSGGPLFNKQGQVVGVLTFGTSSIGNKGDSFAFAIPGTLVKNMIEEKQIIPEQSTWTEAIRGGLEDLQNNRCADANKKFASVRNIVSDSAINKNIDSYINTCKSIIASGQSIDTFSDELKLKMKNFGGLSILFIVLGALLFIGIIFVILKLVTRIRKDESQIIQLEQHNITPEIHQVATIAPNETIINSNIKPIDIGLINYVKGARKAGMTNEIITANLKTGNWSDEDIARALAVVVE